MPEKVFIALDDVRVATPCNASWDKMRGDERTRFCGTCAKNVYNLSEMSRAAAMTLVREKEGHLCVRFYRREDGTMLTDDCPVGLRAVRRPLRWMAGTMALFLTPLLTFGIVLAGGKLGSATPGTSSGAATLSRLRAVQPFKTIADWIDPPAATSPLMGDISMPPPVIGKPVAPPATIPAGSTAPQCEPLDK